MACAGLVHCDKSSKPNEQQQAPAVKLGEPIGVRVDGVKDPSGKVLGNLNGAFAIGQGQAPESLVPGMARVLDRIGKTCPALFAKGSEPIQMRGKIAAGSLSFSPSAGEPADYRCFREAMHGQKVSDTPIESDIAVELRPENSP